MEARGYRARRGQTSQWQGTILAIFALILIITAQNLATAGEIRTASLTFGTDSYRAAALPRVLAPAEAARYERIFALQERGAWSAADHEIARLKDRLLLGHVLAARYLGTAYHASYPELADWLYRYGDEPDARAIFGLAERRQPRGARPPPRPTAPNAALSDLALDRAEADLSPQADLLARQIRTLAAIAPRRADSLLAGAEAKRLLSAATRAELAAAIAQADRAGSTHPARAADAAPSPAALARWNAGLAAWRRDDMSAARSDFEALVQGPEQSSWLRSAAAFWAARVALRTRRPDQVAMWLGIAARQPRTFYGLIARRLLGTDATLDFAAEPFTALDARVITGLESGRRAVALLEIDQRPRAAAELRALAAANNPALLPSLAGLADRADLPALSLRLAGALADADGQSHDRGFYPVPRWTPLDGFTVDRALLFALMRQESLFVPTVTNSSGATGPDAAHAGDGARPGRAQRRQPRARRL